MGRGGGPPQHPGFNGGPGGMPPGMPGGRGGGGPHQGMPPPPPGQRHHPMGMGRGGPPPYPGPGRDGGPWGAGPPPPERGAHLKLGPPYGPVVKGQMVWYKEKDGAWVEVEVVSVDRSIDPPSYGIRLNGPGGATRETERERLSVQRPPPDGEAPKEWAENPPSDRPPKPGYETKEHIPSSCRMHPTFLTCM